MLIIAGIFTPTLFSLLENEYKNERGVYIGVYIWEVWLRVGPAPETLLVSLWSLPFIYVSWSKKVHTFVLLTHNALSRGISKHTLWKKNRSLKI